MSRIIEKKKTEKESSDSQDSLVLDKKKVGQVLTQMEEEKVKDESKVKAKE